MSHRQLLKLRRQKKIVYAYSKKKQKQQTITKKNSKQQQRMARRIQGENMKTYQTERKREYMPTKLFASVNASVIIHGCMMLLLMCVVFHYGNSTQPGFVAGSQIFKGKTR